jgi:sodium-dependent phosphate cotransporter
MLVVVSVIRGSEWIAPTLWKGRLYTSERVVGKVNWKKVGLGLVSLLLFILAIQLMKEGAGTLTPYIRGWFDVDNAANSLGFGWLSAYVILSGSPVAAVALAFFDAGVIGQFEAFTMITGSRLGASFIVLFIGLIYVLRGHERLTSLSMGILSFIITFSLHLPSLLIGYFLLNYHIADPVELRFGASATSVLDTVYDPVIDLVVQNTPGWLTFVLGVGIVIGSLSLFDRALPELKLERTEFAEVPRIIYRPIVMFFAGLIVTAISLSVSVSLSILVPLSARGYMRSENAIAYIMGANVSTFVDTLLVALFLNNPMAVTVVLVQMLCVTIISFATLLLLYRPHERAVMYLTSHTIESNRNMLIFALTILIAPIILMLV